MTYSDLYLEIVNLLIEKTQEGKINWIYDNEDSLDYNPTFQFNTSSTIQYFIKLQFNNITVIKITKNWLLKKERKVILDYKMVPGFYEITMDDQYNACYKQTRILTNLVNSVCKFKDDFTGLMTKLKSL